MIPRDYQETGIVSVFDWLPVNLGNPVVVMPTGTGKSLVIAEIIRRAVQTWNGTRVLMLTHVKELIEQNFEKLLAVWPTAPAGIYSAGLKRRDIHCDITYSGIQSVAKRPELFGHIDLVLIDECHRVSPTETTLYRKFLNALSTTNPRLRVIGLTATPYRLKGGMITDKGGIFSGICYDLSSRDNYNKLVADGYLSRLVPRHPRGVDQFDVSGVAIRGGEFVTKEVQAAVDREELTRGAVAECVREGADRAHWLVFCAGIEHCKNTVAELARQGISAAAIYSGMEKDGLCRDSILAEHKAGKIRAIVNNDVLTTGYDFPGIDLIAVLRPTSSPGLWVQMLGRGTRPVFAPGACLTTSEDRLAAIAAGPKPNCLVLDFAGNLARLGPINDPVVPDAKKKKKKGAAPARLCQHCFTFNPVQVVVCEECGEPFPAGPPQATKLSAHAETGQFVAEAQSPQVLSFVVDGPVTYEKHQSPARMPEGGLVPPTLKVNYHCGTHVFSEYVPFQADTKNAHTRCSEWWEERFRRNANGRGMHLPHTVNEALAQTDFLVRPKEIDVWVNAPRFPEIKHFEF